MFHLETILNYYLMFLLDYFGCRESFLFSREKLKDGNAVFNALNNRMVDDQNFV